MVDFSALLRKPASEDKRPPAFPAGDYPAIIRSHEFGDNNKNKTPYLRLQVGFTSWPEGAQETWTCYTTEGKEYTVAQSDFDLGKRAMRVDMYLTDDSRWRLKELLISCGIDVDSIGYEEAIPQLVGAQVLAAVQQQPSRDGGELFSQITKLVGLAS